MSLRFARPAWISRQRIALLVAFVLATSMSMVVAPHSSASAPNVGLGYWLANSSGAVSAYGGAASFGPVKSRGSTAAVVGIARALTLVAIGWSLLMARYSVLATRSCLARWSGSA